MNTTDTLKGIHAVTVIGAARSGIAAARLLRSHGVSVFISDTCAPDTLDEILAKNNLSDIPHEGGNHTDRVLDAQLIVLSPGVPSDIPILKTARSRNIPVWSEVELAFRMTGATFLGITGSSGKSTTTSLLGAILASAGVRSVVAGNIGTALTEVVEQYQRGAYIAAEVSSFQLETIDQFRPRVAAVLNLSKNHLDRYENEDGYYNAKKRIALNMKPEDTLVLNCNDPLLVDWAKEMSGKVKIVWFGTHAVSGDCVWYADGALYSRMNGFDVETKVIDCVTMKLKGLHNYLDAAAAAAIALAAGISVDAVARGLVTFAGLEHRLEFVTEINGVGFYNDSKATTAESVGCAITAFANNVHLIAGGKDKGCDFSTLNESIKKYVKNIYLIGEAKERMHGQWNGLAPIQFAQTLAEAIDAAIGNAVSGDVIVLSPGCASYDMFDDYEHRGRVFRELVRSFIK